MEGRRDPSEMGGGNYPACPREIQRSNLSSSLNWPYGPLYDGYHRTRYARTCRSNYPVDKKGNKENTENLIQAEKNFDRFWFQFDPNWKRLTSEDISACMGDYTPRQREEVQKIEWTQPWVEPTKEQKPEIQVRREPDLQTQTLTKEAVTDSSNNAPIEEPVPQIIDKQPTFKVDKSLRKIFSTLFFTPESLLHARTCLLGRVPTSNFYNRICNTEATWVHLAIYANKSRCGGECSTS